MGCPFCNRDNIFIESEYCIAFYDEFPVSKGHTLIIPKRHVPYFQDLTIEERIDMIKLEEMVQEECK